MSDGRLVRAMATECDAVFISVGGNDVGELRGFADASRAIFNIRKVVGSFAGSWRALCRWPVSWPKE